MEVRRSLRPYDGEDAEQQVQWEINILGLWWHFVDRAQGRDRDHPRSPTRSSSINDGFALLLKLIIFVTVILIIILIRTSRSFEHGGIPCRCATATGGTDQPAVAAPENIYSSMLFYLLCAPFCATYLHSMIAISCTSDSRSPFRSSTPLRFESPH